MRTIKSGVRSSEVYFLNELLLKLKYNVVVSDYFGKDTDLAVRDFQLKNNLVVDGVVGFKTWSSLLEKSPKTFSATTNKLLSEQDLIDFSNQFNLELAIVKAVNEVESNGKGFLIGGRPKILFEGHVFWEQLKKRNIDPKIYANVGTQDILYPNYTKKYYLGGTAEYLRLDRAKKLGTDKKFTDAANCSASWGLFQIMGFNATDIGYPDIDDFVEKMNRSEGEHLKAFGLYLERNNLITTLRNKNWAAFALRYNGKEYRTNKYDEKLIRAYEKYTG